MPEQSSKPVLAVFDFDGTITYVDSLFPFLRHLVGPSRFSWTLVRCMPVLAGLTFRLVSNAKAKAYVLHRFLANQSEADLNGHAERFATGHLQKLVNPAAMERIKWHQERGHQVVILSASLDSYLRPWAAAHEIRHVVSTRLSWTDQGLRGLDGANCHGHEKVCRLTETFGDLDGYSIYAYGDSESDRPVLAVAEHPFYRSFDAPSIRAKLTNTSRFLRAVVGWS